MYCHIKSQALVLPTEQHAAQYQVSRAGNRQIFSQALDQGEYDNLGQNH